ncbi:MAG: Gfo/Idh/MocA family oxidoreductase [Deltaproteobacteria bacterium]|nr:Gfo/Idh/MocA family oxidoreductase [Deltaproteobacteria bacterium]
MQTIRTAVIGVGYLGRFHAQKYKTLPQSQLMGVVDIHPDRARQVGEELGVESYTGLADILPQVDAVSIAATTSLHYALGMECLKAGKHVLMEKPMASTSGEAAELAFLAEANSLVLQVGFLERFNPAFQASLPFISNPQFIETIRISPFKERGHDVDVVLDLMIHDLDLIFSLVTSPLKGLHAVGTHLMTEQTDLANVRLMFENGAVADITSSRISNKAERKFRVFQSNRYVSMDLSAPSARVYSADRTPGPTGGPTVTEESLPLEKGDALLAEITSFLAAIQNKTPPVVSGRDGVHTMEVAERIIADIAHNRLP